MSEIILPTYRNIISQNRQIKTREKTAEVSEIKDDIENRPVSLPKAFKRGCLKFELTQKC